MARKLHHYLWHEIFSSKLKGGRREVQNLREGKYGDTLIRTSAVLGIKNIG